MIKMEFNVDALQNALNKIADSNILMRAEMQKQAMARAKQIADEVYVESQGLVPRDTEDLANHAKVVKETDGYAIVYTSVFAGSKSHESDYAVTQHEDAELNHPNGGRDKYLEIAFNDKAGNFEKRIGNAVESAIRKVIK